MNGVRIGIVASLLLCIWLAWPKGDGGTPPRPLMIKSALKDAQDPIIMLGDDSVRRAALPRILCRRPVINAGIDGSTTASDLAGMLKKAMGDKTAAMIVVALGHNESDAKLDLAVFRQNYAALLAALKPLTRRLAVSELADDRRGTNAALREIARSASVSVAATSPAGWTNAIEGELCP